MPQDEFIDKVEQLIDEVGLKNATCEEIEKKVGMAPPGIGASDSEILAFERAINGRP
jgi:hypothetical protein